MCGNYNAPAITNFLFIFISILVIFTWLHWPIQMSNDAISITQKKKNNKSSLDVAIVHVLKHGFAFASVD